MSMLMAKLHYFRLPMACLWDTLYRDSHKHAQYMHQHSVICSRTCLWPNCIIFVCLSAFLWDTLYIYKDSRKHAQYMYQHSVICSWVCLWSNWIILVCLWRAYETPYIGILISKPSIVATFCNMLMSMLMAKLHYFRLPMACLWDPLYMDSHKHAQYMYQHSVICSRTCLWPNCIIFVRLWRSYETPYIGILISTPSICIPTFCNMPMSRLMAKLHYFLVRMACLWDTLYRDSHKHVQYMYQHSVI
jgi:hypothetical protein